MTTTRRTPRTIAALVVTVMALAGLATACGGGDAPDVAVNVQVGDPGSSAGDVLAKASQATSAVESGRMRATYQFSGTSHGKSLDASMTADGTFAAFGTQSQLSMDMSPLLSAMGADSVSNAPASWVMSEIVDGTTLYMKSDIQPASAGLPMGPFGSGEWLKMDLGQYESAGQGGTGGLGTGGLTGGPGGYIESLKSAGATVTETGSDVIDGTSVTVYDGTIDPLAAISDAAPDKADAVRRAFEQSGISGSMPFTAYVDDSGMVRRMKITMVGGADGSTLHVEMTIDLFDFGAPVTITPPPADQVHDMGDLVSGLTSKLGTA